MTCHNWKQYEMKKNSMKPDVVAVLKCFKCDRCKEKTATVEYFSNGEPIFDIQGYTVKCDKNWDADCDLALIKLIQEL